MYAAYLKIEHKIYYFCYVASTERPGSQTLSEDNQGVYLLLNLHVSCMLSLTIHIPFQDPQSLYDRLRPYYSGIDENLISIYLIDFK